MVNTRLRNFLVTGTGSSGTMWLRQSLRRKGFAVADETWGVKDAHSAQTISAQVVNTTGGRDGMVSWTARCYASGEELRALAESDDGYGHELWSVQLQVRFQVIIQLVRHPLAFVRSNLFFSDDIRTCRRLDDDGSNESSILRCDLNWWRLQIWHYVSVFTPELENDDGRKKLWWEEDPIALSAVHWHSWNLRVEKVADLRVRVEDGRDGYSAPSRVCEWLLAQGRAALVPWSWEGGGAQTANINCSLNDAPRGLNSHTTRRGGRGEVTWGMLDSALGPGERRDWNGGLITASAIRDMSRRYGYLA